MSAPDLSSLARKIGRATPRSAEDQRMVLGELGEVCTALRDGPHQAVARRLEAAVVLMECRGDMPSVAPETLFEILFQLVDGGRRSLEGERLPGLRPAGRDASSTGTGELLKVTSGDEVDEVLIGGVLMNLGVVTAAQVDEALALSLQTGMRIGTALVRAGAATTKQVEKALRIQNQLRYGMPMNAANRRPEPGPPPALPERDAPLRMASEVLFGEVAVRLGLATAEHVRAALTHQNALGIRLGEALVNAGVMTWEQVDKVVAWQSRLRRGGDVHTSATNPWRGSR